MLHRIEISALQYHGEYAWMRGRGLGIVLLHRVFVVHTPGALQPLEMQRGGGCVAFPLSGRRGSPCARIAVERIVFVARHGIDKTMILVTQ